MSRYLQRRRRQLYAVLEIPKALRQHFKKPRFVMSLKTDSLSLAEQKVLPIIAEWKRQIAIARGIDIGSGDELLATLARVRQDAQIKLSRGVADYEIQMAQEEVAMNEALGPSNDYSGDYTLIDAVSVAHGESHLMVEHIEEYLSSKDLAPKTVDMQRRDINVFSEEFPYAHNATRDKVLEWVNVTLGTEQGLSLGTRSRMVSAVRGYWDYLERYKGLKLQPPFHKVLPPKPKKKTKAQIEAQRRAFRGEDYRKLLAACSDDSLKDLMTLAAYTGCRIEELCSLKLNEVSDNTFEIVDAKSEAGWRTVPIHSHISQLVARLLATSKDGYLLSDLTFNKYGNRSNAIGKRFGRLKAGLGYGEFHVFHSFRKGFATQLENANIPLNVSARLMGHEVEGQTFGNYSEGLALRQLREAISVIGWR